MQGLPVAAVPAPGVGVLTPGVWVPPPGAAAGAVVPVPGVGVAPGVGAHLLV